MPITPHLSVGLDKKTSGPIRGRVLNEKGEPVEGVSVTVKGSNVGTSTNANGEFFLDEIDDNATLVFTHTSIEKVEQKRNGRGELTVGVKVRSSILDEVQVIPYGTQTKRFSVGNVTTVKGEDIAKQPVNNPLLALQGRVPGLFIKQETGMPGGDVTVRIQGQNSIGSGNEPLYVVDGVPYPAQLPPTSGSAIQGNGGGNPLSFINPTDIASIDVLKDADATAIYGSRAANGAILITTKRGVAGQTRVDLNLQQGWSKVPRKLDMLNTRQYLDMRYEAYKNDGIDWTDPNLSANDLKVWDTTRYTDWQKELIGGTAQYTNMSVSVSAGSAISQYLVGATWNRQTTVFPADFDDQRGSVHFQLNNSSRDEKFNLQLSANYMVNQNHLPGGDLTESAVLLEPNSPALYNPDGSLNWAPNSEGNSTWNNPLANYTLSKYKSNTKNLVSNFQIAYQLLPGLELRTSGGYTNIQTSNITTFPLSAVGPELRPFLQRSGYYGSNQFASWIVEPQLLYKKVIGKGKLEGLLGSSVQQTNNDYNTIRGTGHSSDLLLEDMKSATTLMANSRAFIYKYNALFARLNYNRQRKYMFSASARRDGSSRFGDANKFHNFWSVGEAWIFTEEPVVRNSLPFLSFGKLKASYGTTGNDQIPDNSYLALYYSTFSELPYQNTPGLFAAGFSNPYLQWEETRKWQTGMELGFFKDRVLLNATYSRNRSSNQLLPYALPSFTGFNSITQNFPATVQNTSWEFSLNTINVISRSFEWTTSFNITVPRNELISFPNLETSSYSNFLFIGQPLGTERTIPFKGVDPATGLYQAVDQHGSPTFSPTYPDDFSVLVNTLPKFYGGLQNNLVYKGFELDFFLQFVRQTGRNNFYFSGGWYVPGRFFWPGLGNQPVSVMNRWQKPGDDRPIQKFSTTLFFPLAAGSDAAYADASFIRLKNVSASWKLPKEWLQRVHLQQCSVYAQGQNLLTFTHYQGLDPETQNINKLPPLRAITIGVKLGL
jgi:TonB-dependent starch-binding outer membrane protein SusC